MGRIGRDVAINVIAGCAVGLVSTYVSSGRVGLWAGLTVGIVGLVGSLIWERQRSKRKQPPSASLSPSPGPVAFRIMPGADDGVMIDSKVHGDSVGIENHAKRTRIIRSEISAGQREPHQPPLKKRRKPRDGKSQ